MGQLGGPEGNGKQARAAPKRAPKAQEGPKTVQEAPQRAPREGSRPYIWNLFPQDGLRVPASPHEFPRTPQENWKFWGPFPNAGDAKRVIKLIRRYFGIRDKRGNLPFGFIEDNGYGDYSKRIETVCRILNGNAGELIIELQNEMDKFSEGLDFENAARTRDMIVTLQNTISQNIVSSRFYQDCDAVGFSSQGDRGCVVILHTKDGIIQAKES